MDLNRLLHRHQLSLMNAGESLSPREKSAHNQFAREYAEQIDRTRQALGARPARRGSVT